MSGITRQFSKKELILKRQLMIQKAGISYDWFRALIRLKGEKEALNWLEEHNFYDEARSWRDYTYLIGE